MASPLLRQGVPAWSRGQPMDAERRLLELWYFNAREFEGEETLSDSILAIPCLECDV